MRSRHLSSAALAALAAFALALVLAACGAATSEQLDAEELASRADEICREGIDRFGEIQAEKPENAVEAEEQTAELYEVASDELDDLRALRAPDELRDAYDEYLTARGRALEQLERGRDAAGEKDGEAYAKAQNEATAGQKKRLELAGEVGLEVCSKPG